MLPGRGGDLLGDGGDAHDLEMKILYRSDLFEATTIERMADQYRYLLGAILRNPEQTIDLLPLEDPAEEERRRMQKLALKAKKSKSLKRARRGRNRVGSDDV